MRAVIIIIMIIITVTVIHHKLPSDLETVSMAPSSLLLAGSTISLAAALLFVRHKRRDAAARRRDAPVVELRSLSPDAVPRELTVGFYFDLQAHPTEHAEFLTSSSSVIAVGCPAFVGTMPKQTPP